MVNTTAKFRPLRLISGHEMLVIDETDGTETMASAKDVFPAGFDTDFVCWGGFEASGQTTVKTPVAVYELVRKATFQQMFGSVSADPGRLCLAEGQTEHFSSFDQRENSLLPVSASVPPRCSARASVGSRATAIGRPCSGLA